MFDIIKLLMNILYTRGDFMSEQNTGPENLNWDDLGFSYRKTDYRYISHFKNGSWDEGQLVEDNTLELDIKWEWLYGSLENGYYRIVKSVNNKEFSIEFKID